MTAFNHSKITGDEASTRPFNVEPHALQSLIRMGVDLAQHGREGKRVGALFIVGDHDEVLERSHPLILDPLQGHGEDVRSVHSPGMRGTIRELCLLDGAFVVSAEGIVQSAARCIDVNTRDVDVPHGLGSRHLAAASITNETSAIALVVSQSSPVVRMFRDGVIVDEFEAREREQSPRPSRRPSAAPRELTETLGMTRPRRFASHYALANTAAQLVGAYRT